MARNNFKRYVWLIDLINSCGHITRERISELWARSAANENKDSYLPERTFHNHLAAIEDIFGIEIKNDRTLGYYIDDSKDVAINGARKWLLESISLNNLLNEAVSMRESVIFEQIPSSQVHLTTIVEAIRDGKVLNITYQSFHKEFPWTFEAKPYCLKLFKQRWYMVAMTEADEKPWIYCLDRILRIERTEKSYTIPALFYAPGYFRNLYGVCADDDIAVEDVLLKVDKSQVKFYKTLPLHHSQEEVETTDDYSIFKYHLKPTYDFTQELLSKANSIEVLAPAWYREHFKDEVKGMLSRYED